MKNLRLAWLLLKLCRRIERDSEDRTVGASFTLTIEGGAGYDERVMDARLAGQFPPPRRRGYEVCYWPNSQEAAVVRRGNDFGRALEQVLRDR